MKTAADIFDVVSRLQYRDWTFEVHTDDLERVYLQIEFAADGEHWKSRKWLLSPHMTDSEIVQTALKAVLTAEEHEAREHFRYRGVAIFGPHLDVEQLCAIATASTLDARAS